MKTASLYNVIKNFTAPSKDNEWFTEEIIVEGKHIITKVDGKTIVDYNEPDQLDRAFPSSTKAPSRCKLTIRRARCVIERSK